MRVSWSPENQAYFENCQINYNLVQVIKQCLETKVEDQLDGLGVPEYED